MKQISSLLFALLFAMPFLVKAQKLSGNITSFDGPVIGASISVGPGIGTTSDQEGKYSLNLSPGSYTVTVKYIGYVPQSNKVTLSADEAKTWDVTLVQDAVTFGDVIIVGTRTAPRSSVNTAVPVDVLLSKDLQETGQATFDKALQYRIPSFNTVQTPVNDATSLADPYEIRNMGPSRTLVLINGKRKNASSLVYTQTSPGRGESVVDIAAIPMDAIKRIEILRDGASAQYGSDAIAGVMNIILKDNSDRGYATLRTGITSKGDGEMFGLSLNNGAKIGEKGFINYTAEVSKIGQANRPGTVNAEGEAGDFGADIKDVKDFLKLKPDAGNINGSPATTASKFLVNGGTGLDEHTDVYYNAAYVYKNVNSFANYRTPYWRRERSLSRVRSHFRWYIK
jgi:iron complex outermembrane recepter protein